MDGFTFLRVVMSKRPTPVMVISGRSGEEDVFKALDLGAVDFIAKPTPRATPELVNIERELIRKVHAIRELRIERCASASTLPPHGAGAPRAPGAEDGGDRLLDRRAGGADADLRRFLRRPRLRLRRGPAHAGGLHRRLRRARGPADAVSRARGARRRGAEPGSVLVAPGGRHLELEIARGRRRDAAGAGRARDKYAPSVDRLFMSAAKHFGATWWRWC